MNNRQNGRRRRGGGGGGSPRPMGQNLGGQVGNRLEVRVRGNAHQLLEKYKVLARDAHQAGDRVAAEYYLQHADHYFRVLNDSRIRQEEMRARRGMFDPLDDVLDEDEAPEGGFDPPPPFGTEPVGRAEGAQRHDRRDRNRFDRPREPLQGSEQAAAVAAAETSGSPDLAAEAAETMSDGEAALLAFGGAPAGAEGQAAEAPRPARRRGRPRRSEPAPAEG